MTNLDNKKCVDILSEPPPSSLKSIIHCPCQCSNRFLRDCHILRHLRFRNCNDVINTQKYDSKNYTFYKCKFCGITYNHPSAFKRHIHFHTAARKFKCSVCGDRFSKKHVLNSHIHSQHDESKNICEACGYVYKSKIDIDTHMNSYHSDIIKKPYSCNYCKCRFERKHHLVVHIRTHTGERPYTCGECGNRFKSSSNLYSHMKIHTGLKPYVCKYCTKAFNRKYNLNVHIRNIHHHTM